MLIKMVLILCSLSDGESLRIILVALIFPLTGLAIWFALKVICSNSIWHGPNRFTNYMNWGIKTNSSTYINYYFRDYTGYLKIAYLVFRY